MAYAQPTTAAAQPATAISPVLVILATALKLTTTDAATHRAIDSALTYLASAPVYEFDGVELRLVSLSERAAGTIHVTDGTGCTCKSGHRPVCRCRMIFRLLLAEAALTAPTTLLASIAEQTDPNPVGADIDTDAADDDWEAYHRQGAEQYRVDAIRQGTWSAQEGPVISLVATPAAPVAKRFKVSDADLAAATAFFD